MKYFKQEPTNLLDILNQSLWYNNYTKSGGNYLINNRPEYKGISKLKDIQEEKYDFIDQSKINLKYKVIISFLELLNITSCISKSWKKILNNCQHLLQNIPIENCIQVQNTLKSLNKTTCKDMYWHILNLENYNYKPTCIKKWTKLYPDFSTAHKSIWIRIFKLPFKTVRDTKLQTFQYRILHHIIPCNEWLFNIKIKNSNICSLCNETDTLPHFFVKCRKVNNVWKYWFNWWKILTNQDVMKQYNDLEKCILMGFPETSDDILILNYCILFTIY